MSAIFTDGDLEDCDNIFILTKSSKNIEIYGEIHNKPIGENNSYIKMIAEISEYSPKPLVLVEHSSNNCNLDNLPDDMVKYILSRGGSETIFYHLQLTDYPKLHCIDNRVELNLLSGQEEFYYKSLIEEILDKNIPESREIIEPIITILSDQLAIFNGDTIKQIFATSVYSMLYQTYINVFKRHFTIIRLCLNNRTKDKDFFKKDFNGESNWDIFNILILLLLTNMQKLGSLIVDINIINTIKKSRSPNIILYTGLNHAHRVSYILSNTRDMSKLLGVAINNIYDLTIKKLDSGYNLLDVAPSKISIDSSEETNIMLHLLNLLKPI